MVYPSSEHAYQAAKSLDMQVRLSVAGKATAAAAKSAGSALVLRSDWDEVKLQVMYDILWDKFTRHDDLREKLLATGAEDLVEGNTWNDTYWGVCRGVGLNHLGRILMRIRIELMLDNVPVT